MTAPAITPPKTMRAALTSALITLALREADPAERAARIAILRKDGWVKDGDRVVQIAGSVRQAGLTNTMSIREM